MAREKFVCPRCGKKRPQDQMAAITFQHSGGALRQITVCEKCCLKIQEKALTTSRKAKRNERRELAAGADGSAAEG